MILKHFFTIRAFYYRVYLYIRCRGGGAALRGCGGGHHVGRWWRSSCRVLLLFVVVVAVLVVVVLLIMSGGCRGVGSDGVVVVVAYGVPFGALWSLLMVSGCCSSVRVVFVACRGCGVVLVALMVSGVCRGVLPILSGVLLFVVVGCRESAGGALRCGRFFVVVLMGRPSRCQFVDCRGCGGLWRAIGEATPPPASFHGGPGTPTHISAW